MEQRQIVGPPGIVTCEQLRVAVERLRSIEVLGRVQQHSELAVRAGEIGVARVHLLQRHEAFVSLARLNLHALVGTREIWQRHGDKRVPH
jgi:hypothetical protein